jgi:hypothetical protein
MEEYAVPHGGSNVYQGAREFEQKQRNLPFACFIHSEDVDRDPSFCYWPGQCRRSRAPKRLERALGREQRCMGGDEWLSGWGQNGMGWQDGREAR